MLQHGDFSNAWTFKRDGLLIAAGGLQVLWRGRAEAWSFFAEDVDRWDLLYLTREIRRRMEAVRERLGLRRLEATTVFGWSPGERWLERLGFQPEARLALYGPDGRDHRMYARTWPSSPQSPS